MSDYQHTINKKAKLQNYYINKEHQDLANDKRVPNKIKLQI